MIAFKGWPRYENKDSRNTCFNDEYSVNIIWFSVVLKTNSRKFI